jgi:hypothetical protein
MYVFWCLGDTKFSLGFTGELQGACMRIGVRNTSLLQELESMLRYAVLKKICRRTNKHYCMNTDNNVAEMTQRLKCWPG